MRFDSGRVSLDLVATRAGRHPVEEQLASAESLGEWIRGAGLVPQGTAVVVDEEWLPAFTRLRDVVRRMVTAELAGREQDRADIAALNEAARPAPPALCALPAAG